jgi:hypothetical protein
MAAQKQIRMFVFHFFPRACRILDNLPMVVLIMGFYQDLLPFYQRGVHLGLKGRYSGVGP